jgi:thioredoxin reductase
VSLVAASGPGEPWTALLAHVSGMLAGYGVLVLLLLMARTPVLERGVGADVLARCLTEVPGVWVAGDVADVTAQVMASAAVRGATRAMRIRLQPVPR